VVRTLRIDLMGWSRSNVRWLSYNLVTMSGCGMRARRPSSNARCINAFTVNRQNVRQIILKTKRRAHARRG
jgi:hypothetical protein